MTDQIIGIIQCKYHPAGHSDEAKRCADTVNLHYTALGHEAVGKWVAIRLSDGGSDGNLYDTRKDAVRHAVTHQLSEFACTYIQLIPIRYMDVCDAQIFLTFSRNAYDAGFRMSDPDAKDGGKQLIVPNRVEKRLEQSRLLRQTARRNRRT